MDQSNSICQEFARILNGKGKMDQGVCSVELRRRFNARVQGRPSSTVTPVGVSFESLDQNGTALNLGEIAILPQEIPAFVQSVSGQGITVSALHNHWIFTDPHILYIHIQSVEPPVNFAKKVANAFTTLSSSPIAKS